MGQIPLVKKAIEVPEDVTLTLEGDEVRVRGPRGELKKRLHYPGVKISQEDGNVVVEADFPQKRQMAIIGTYVAHIKNMIKGVTEGFTYRLKAVYSHFPITVKSQGEEVLVENFLGERVPRKMRVYGDCKVKVQGQDITIEGINKEEVGQTAARLESLTKVSKNDRRVFQDGIVLVEKDEVKI